MKVWRPITGLLFVTLLTVALLGVGQVDRRYPWIWSYLTDQLQPEPAQATAGPTHILFTFVDHFEPHDPAAVERWITDYPALARLHRDADGVPPQHTWFWYFGRSDEEESLQFLRQLSQLSFEGWGEVELHLHHFNDNERTFLKKMDRMIGLSQKVGAMVTAEPTPRTAFGFIHGMWALDNSRNGQHCGVNNELALLRRLGCYADFTHPSWGPMHPRIVNRLYYAVDDPERPKSYDTGVPLKVGKPPTGDLLIFEGPSVVRFRGIRPVYDHGDVTVQDLPTPERIDDWIRAGIHVQGRPDWVFVKVFTHGAVGQDHEAVLGEWAGRMYRYLETQYNDGLNYALHYVTAREAYNIAKAAEQGRGGNPNDYRNFLIPPYANRFLSASVPYRLISMEEGKIVAQFFSPPGSRVSARLREEKVQVQGEAADLSVSSGREEVWVQFTLTGEGIVEFLLR